MRHGEIVSGRNLRRLFDHCLRKQVQAVRDFGQDDGQPLVEEIEVKDVTPKAKEGRE